MRLPLKLNPSVSVEIAGTGHYLPERVMTNAEMEKIVDTNNDWIVERTGIHERRLAKDSVATSDMAIEASKLALERANIAAEDIDIIICATITPDMQLPSTACLVQKGIGAKNAFAFDIGAACTGFIYALSTAYSFIASGTATNALVIGAEKLSSVTDYKDRNTCILFGDGAGAAVIKKTENSNQGIMDFILESDGRNAHWLQVPGGGSRKPLNADNISDNDQFITMAGREVFKFAVTAMKRTTVKIAERNGISAEEIRWLIPHQANKRIIDAAANSLGLDESRIHYNIHKYGNMSAASTAVGLSEIVESGTVNPGDYLLLVAFGAGMTWGSILIKW